MNVYFLTATDALDTNGYDVCRGAVVIEETEARARRLVPCGDECGCGRGRRGECVWECAELTSATVIGVAAADAPSGLVMRDFNNG